MERFQTFIGRTLERARLDNRGALESAGLEPRYLPDSFEEFDEVDFLAPLEGENRMVLSIAIEQDRIQRILLGWVTPGDPDDAMRSFDPDGLEKALEVNGDKVAAFLDEILA